MSDNSHDAVDIVMGLLYKPELGKLIPEPDSSGNIEYKLRLDKKDILRKDKMVSQMLWRMNEGKNQFGRYEAHYILGIHDDGSFSTMVEHEINTTVGILRGIAKKANANIIKETKYVFPGNRMICHVVVRKITDDRNVPEINIMIMGPTDVGKSSLMGSLTYGQRDDGKGFTRKLVLRHMHEKNSGNTSCPKYDTIGFHRENLMNYSIGIEFNMEDIYKSSDRLINLIDVPGDMRCIKTLLYTVASVVPDNIIICIPCKTIEYSDELVKSDTRVIKRCMDPLGYIAAHEDMYRFIVDTCIIYNINPIIVLTKSDLLRSTDKITLYQKQIKELFNRWRNNKIGIEKFVGFGSRIEKNKPSEREKDNSDMDMFGDMDSGAMFDDSTSNASDDTIGHTGVFIDFERSIAIAVSNVTEYGYSNLIGHLCALTQNQKIQKIESKVKDFGVQSSVDNRLFVVSDSFTIPDTGTIYYGVLRQGKITVDEEVDVLCHGQIVKRKIKSIHRKALDVDHLLSGETGSITFYGNADKMIDKTAMIICPAHKKNIVSSAAIMSAFDTVKLKSQQYMLFVDNNIATVLLSATEEPSVYIITCVNNKFIPVSGYGILKDEFHRYYFIKFL